MPLRVLGKADYTARRLGGITYLTAIGETPNMNDKTDFEQLPFMTHPPMFAFYFIHQEVSLPAMRPFTYQESIFYPKSAKSVRIQDSEGVHEVAISEVTVPDFDVQKPNSEEGGYCVFSWIGINPLVIAKCDAILPSVYSKVFGPATYKESEEYVRDTSGN